MFKIEMLMSLLLSDRILKFWYNNKTVDFDKKTNGFVVIDVKDQIPTLQLL